jgi:hypothetical protein
MSHFLKLTNCFINTRQIKIIYFESNSYVIKLINDSKGFLMYDTSTNPVNFTLLHPLKIKICKTDHPENYKIVTDWIEKTKK